MNLKWNRMGFLAGGFLLGTYGLKLLGSRDMKNAYVHCTAAALRMKDEVLKDFTTLRENAEDISASAKDINEKRREEAQARMIEDAKAILEAACRKETAH